ncbi:hypothetical protein LH464_01155 [Neorhizobium sp. T786]|uniref:hypothetical protein n=1 Tax=Pseudorhizobium xiangyangii TaxID=2883104 RepID=UPI001CFF5B62|nr:hypothetical protein [Neorhizobium xiangyangii]MCB5201083.1 hypothetical protein [Neorhizobium xiangyangii]
MEQVLTPAHRLPLLLLASLMGTGLFAAAFYGWMQYGSTMLLTLGEAGLSTCL